MSSRLAVEIAGLKLGNPVMLASGILGLSGVTLKRVADAGAGAVVTKNVTARVTDMGMLASPFNVLENCEYPLVKP